MEEALCFLHFFISGRMVLGSQFLIKRTNVLKTLAITALKCYTVTEHTFGIGGPHGNRTGNHRITGKTADIG